MDRKLSTFIKGTEKLEHIHKDLLVLEIEELEMELEKSVRFLRMTLLVLDKESYLYKYMKRFVDKREDTDV